MSSEIDKTEQKLSRDENQTQKKVSIEPRDLAYAAAYLAENIKGEDTAILDVSGRCSYADFFVLTSGQSERQTQAIARNIGDSLRKGGLTPAVEGLKEGAWVLIDLGDVIAHCFLDSARDYYDIETFWKHAERVPSNDERALDTLSKLGLDAQGNPI